MAAPPEGIAVSPHKFRVAQWIPDASLRLRNVARNGHPTKPLGVLEAAETPRLFARRMRECAVKPSYRIVRRHIRERLSPPDAQIVINESQCSCLHGGRPYSTATQDPAMAVQPPGCQSAPYRSRS